MHKEQLTWHFPLDSTDWSKHGGKFSIERVVTIDWSSSRVTNPSRLHLQIAVTLLWMNKCPPQHPYLNLSPISPPTVLSLSPVKKCQTTWLYLLETAWQLKELQKQWKQHYATSFAKLQICFDPTNALQGKEKLKIWRLRMKEPQNPGITKTLSLWFESFTVNRFYHWFGSRKRFNNYSRESLISLRMQTFLQSILPQQAMLMLLRRKMGMGLTLTTWCLTWGTATTLPGMLTLSNCFFRNSRGLLIKNSGLFTNLTTMFKRYLRTDTRSYGWHDSKDNPSLHRTARLKPQKRLKHGWSVSWISRGRRVDKVSANRMYVVILYSIQFLLIAS